ncbi:MAG: dipeptidase [Chlamydiota bacterium]
MDQKEILESWYEKNFTTFFSEYCTFLQFPSISTDPAYKKQVVSCAKWLVAYLQKMGFASELIDTSNAPIVYGEYIVDKKYPTLLIYGHYDVQPADPIEEWESDPFQPMVKDNKVFARGAVDDKGQVFYTLFALQFLMQNLGSLSLNIKLCIDGEEESGSEGLSLALPRLKQKMKANYLVAVDSGIPEENIPAITLGYRGITQLGLELQGSYSDLHSGTHGGIAYNPIRALVQMLATLWNEDGTIAVPGFYEDVIPITEEEKREVNWDFDQKKYQKTFGIEAFWKEKGYSLMETNWIRPTIEVNGIGGGYCKEGFKTVIPAKALAKLSCRLVPKQNPEKIILLLKDFLMKKVPKGMHVKWEKEKGGEAFRASSSSVLAESFALAYSEVFERPCQKVLGAASIPVIAEMVHQLQCELVLVGMGLKTDNMHAPNEHFGLDRLKKGFFVMVRAMQLLSTKRV